MITITVLKNPFNHQDRELHTCAFSPGKTAYEYIQPYIMGLDDFVVSVSGQVAADPRTQAVNSGDWLAVCPIVGKSGSDWFRMIFSVALSVWVGQWGNNWHIFGDKFFNQMAAGAVGMVGGALINHWFPPANADRATVDTKATYNWSSAQTRTGQGNALAVTFGTMRTTGQIVAQHVSSADENQYLNVLLCGGQGPIDAISDIRINDNPVSYYKGVTVDTRLGANDQAVIANFNDTYVDQQLGYELNTDGIWAAQQTEGSAVQGLEVTLEFPAGLYHIKDDGGLENASVKAQMQYRKVGDVDWRNLTTATITAAKNNAFFRTYRVDNLPAARYEVQAQCLSKSGTDTRYSTRVYWTQLSSILYDDFVRPGKVLVAVKALATNQLSGGAPSITWLQTRNNVWVWNADTSRYEQKSANNPAWAAYDIIHRCRQLKNINTGSDEFVVQGAPAARLVYQDFASWAAFCDERGLTFDYIYETADDLWASLQKPEGVGRGKVIMRGTKFGCVCDAPGQPVQLFTVGNIITDKFKETFVSQKDRANAIEITFPNKDKAYQKEVITAYADDYDGATEPNITQITLDGATTVAQAYREGKYRLRLNQYLTRTVEHSADIDAIACQINDVVLLAHDVPQWGFSGRLQAATPSTLTLDRQVDLEPGKTYAVALQITNPSATTPQAAQSIVIVEVASVTVATTTDTLTVMIKAVDNSGNESANAAYVPINFGDEIVANLLAETDYNPVWAGTKTNCRVVNGELWANDPGSKMYPPGAGVGVQFYPQSLKAKFYSPIFGEMSYEDTFIPETAGNMGMQFTGSGDYQLFYRREYPDIMWADDDAPMWNDDEALMWQENIDWLPYTGKIVIRREEFVVKAVIKAGAQGMIQELKAYIDVPDIVEDHLSVAIAATGTRVMPRAAMRAVKRVRMDLVDDGGQAIGIKYLDKDATLGPLIKCYDASGNAVAGLADITMEGY